MTLARFLLHLPRAAARDLWQWLITEPACRFANQTNEDPNDA